MELFPITLPKQNLCQETELYYRSTRPVQYNEAAGQIILPRHSVLTLDTYFNCFSYSKYQQYTCAAVLEVHVKIQGEAQLRLMKAEQKGRTVQRTALLTQQVRRQQLEAVTLLYDFSRETGNGFLYLEVTALSREVVLEPGHYGSPIPDARLNPTKLAAVICTYKREEYVKRNLQHLNQSIFAQPQQEIARHLEVFVVDNGKTLDRAEIETEQIRLFPNKNCGGSGGFTRGIIEALRRSEEFSHVLLMDDDILLESNVLIKTIRFLQIVRPEHADLAIGGSMLRLDRMQIQHEAGGRWTGYNVDTSRANMNLAQVKSLLQNELFDHTDFCGWWYLCIPLVLIDENNLPMPYFIKNDDVEYGLRVTKKLDFINGIGVWHEPFEKKEAAILEYYYVRNILITNAIHDNAMSKSVYLFIRRVGKHILRKDYLAAQIPFLALDDWFAGLAHFETIFPDQFHTQLMFRYGKLITQKNETRYTFVQTIMKTLGYCIKLYLYYPQKKKDYKNGYLKVCNLEFWNKKMELYES